MIKKITVTTGTRAEYGILRSLLKEIKKSKKLKLFLLVTGSHLSKKHGYTIKDIHMDNGLLALAAGHDGLLLYNWNVNDVSFMGKIETSYANNVKIAGNIIFAATEDGIEIIQIEY